MPVCTISTRPTSTRRSPKMKASRTTVAHRVEAVEQIIILGGQFSDLREYAKSEKWNVSESKLYRYQQRAFENFLASTEKDKDRLFAQHLRQLKEIYKRAMEGNDL